MVKESLYKQFELCIKGSPLFSDFNDDDVMQLIHDKIIIKYRHNETIIKHNSRAIQAFIVLSGNVKLYAEGSDGRNFIFSYAGTCSFIGVSGLFTGERYMYSAAAVDECTACFISYDLIEFFLKKYVSFSRGLLDLFSNNQKMLLGRFAFMNEKQSPGKVAHAILYLKNEIFSDLNQQVSASRSEIAEITGMSKDNAGRILKDFVESGLIEFNGKSITVLNTYKLKKISDLG